MSPRGLHPRFAPATLHSIRADRFLLRDHEGLGNPTFQFSTCGLYLSNFKITHPKTVHSNTCHRSREGWSRSPRTVSVPPNPQPPAHTLRSPLPQICPPVALLHAPIALP